MSTKIVSINGYANKNEQFVVKTEKFDIRISKNNQQPELEGPSPIEYVLAGYAGCINAVGTLVAKELNIDLKSLQLEVTGTMNLHKYQGKPTSARAGFNNIEVVVKPNADATTEELTNWLSLVEERCPVYDNLFNPTPIQTSLINELVIEEAY
jgi:uncharacterized OsmC-like protein